MAYVMEAMSSAQNTTVALYETLWHTPKCYISRMHQPMEVLVDYNGYRIHASSEMPIDVAKYDSKGRLKSIGQDLVYGSRDRGNTFKNEDTVVHAKLKEAAEKLDSKSTASKASRICCRSL